MTDILKDIQKKLPKVINSANFEGANIVLYTNDLDFFRDNQGKIRELVNEFKKRIELRVDPSLLKTQEETEKIIKEIKDKTYWIPQIQRSPAIRSKITENIRAVLYQNNAARKRFLNSVGKKIYKEWNPEKIEEWIRVTFLGSG